MPATVSIDSERRLTSYRFWGPVTGPEFVETMVAILRSHPEVADYDAICDLTDYTGDVGVDEMASVAMLMNDLRTGVSGMARSALITLDQGFADWAQLLGHQFERRRFGVFGSRSAAEAWLEGGRLTSEAA